ncbi:MAG: hypothetical protein K5679_00230 [Lachnospiraceae bacterium]|nr:hypothetical protein [Lachnospiraceae bacterium]
MEFDLFKFAMRFLGFVFIFTCGFAVWFFMSNYFKNNGESFKSDYEIAHEESWQVFYNGEEVDIDNVDFKQYNCSYDRERKKVFLTDKTPSGGTSGFEWFLISRSLGW